MGNLILSNIEIVDIIRKKIFKEWLNGVIDDEDISEWEVFLCNIEHKSKY